jgi:putative oxidoreductase
MHRWIPAPVADVVLLFARAAIGVVFVAHGWHKLHTDGIGHTQHMFKTIGIPAPSISALYTTFVELVGGAMLIAGLLVPLAGVLLFLTMAGAFFFVHMDKGIFVSEGGYEYVLALGAATLTLAAVGGGRYGADGLLATRRSTGALPTPAVRDLNRPLKEEPAAGRIDRE